MEKAQHIEYWKKTSHKDWSAVQDLFRTKNYLHALFFAHLALEKLCKAHWIKAHESNYPPKIHNLLYLIDNSLLKPDEIQRILLEKMNIFQLEGRYPDYKYKIYKMCTRKFTDEMLIKVKILRKWLLQNLS